MADNEVLFYLNSLGSEFFIRQEGAMLERPNGLESTPEKEISQKIQDGATLANNIGQNVSSFHIT